MAFSKEDLAKYLSKEFEVEMIDAQRAVEKFYVQCEADETPVEMWPDIEEAAEHVYDHQVFWEL